jgi:DNA-directed RNA polymerase specialized sigma24 family protein
LVRRLGYALSEVAAYFGRDVATVATLLARMGERMQSDEKQMREISRFLKIVET